MPFKLNPITGKFDYYKNSSTAQSDPIGPEFTYTDGILTRIDYDDLSYKVFTYSSGVLSQIDFFKSTETIRKTFNYASGVLTSIDQAVI